MDMVKEQQQQQASGGGAPNSEELAAKRTDYYSKWDKFADETVKQVELEDEQEKVAAAEKLGLNKDAPKSEAEKQDREKREALREAKKLWDNRKLAEEAQRAVIGDGHDGVEHVIDEAFLGNRRVIHFKDSKNSKYVLPSNMNLRLVKIFIENCNNCTFDINAATISQHLEVSFCDNCEVRVGASTAIVQADVCKSLQVRYGENVFDMTQHKIFHAGLSDSKIHIHVSDGVKSLDVDYIKDGAEEHHQKTLEEHQFVSHFYDGDLVTETVYRSKGNMPLTAREIEEAEAKGDGDGLQTSERLAELKKVGGNEAFAEGNYAQAAIFYTEAIDQAPPSSKILPVCYSNRSFAYMKMGHLEEALADAEQSVKLDPKYCKGLFRQGLALHALKRYAEACRALTQALDLEPKNEQIKQALGFAEIKARKAHMCA